MVAFTKAFNLATPINLLTHYAKGTPSFLIRISTAYRITNSRSISPNFNIDSCCLPYLACFRRPKGYTEIQLIKILCLLHAFQTFPSQYFFTIAKFIILSLRGWYPYVPTSYLSSYLFSSI